MLRLAGGVTNPASFVGPTYPGAIDSKPNKTLAVAYVLVRDCGRQGASSTWRRGTTDQTQPRIWRQEACRSPTDSFFRSLTTEILMSVLLYAFDQSFEGRISTHTALKWESDGVVQLVREKRGRNKGKIRGSGPTPVAPAAGRCRPRLATSLLFTAFEIATALTPLRLANSRMEMSIAALDSNPDWPRPRCHVQAANAGIFPRSIREPNCSLTSLCKAK